MKLLPYKVKCQWCAKLFVPHHSSQTNCSKCKKANLKDNIDISHKIRSDFEIKIVGVSDER